MVEKLSKFVELIEAINERSGQIAIKAKDKNGYPDFSTCRDDVYNLSMQINKICSEFKQLDKQYNEAIDKIIK